MVLAQRPSLDHQDSIRVRRAQAGDSDAFAELFEAHGRDVERVALRIVRNPDDARDVAQDAWLSVAKNLPALRDPDLFQPWLRRIARNRSLDFVGRKRCPEAPRFAFEGEEASDPLDAVVDSDTATPEQALLSHDEQRKVWEALGRLSEADRSLLRMREDQGMSYAEISAALGTQRNAAEVRVFRARARFRAQYEAVDADDRSCEVTAIELSALLEDELTDDHFYRVESHVLRCTECRDRLRAMLTGRAFYQPRPEPRQRSLTA